MHTNVTAAMSTTVRTPADADPDGTPGARAGPGAVPAFSWVDEDT